MVDWLLSIPSGLVVLVIGGSIFAESAFIPALVLPGTTAVLSMGVVIGLGSVPAPLGYAVAVLAAVAGTGASWRAGATGGPALRATSFGEKVGAERWERADALVAQRGRSAIAVGQFVVVTRTLVPLLNGIAGIPYRRFAVVSIPAATLWALCLTALGQAAGSNYQRVQDVLGDRPRHLGDHPELRGPVGGRPRQRRAQARTSGPERAQQVPLGHRLLRALGHRREGQPGHRPPVRAATGS